MRVLYISGMYPTPAFPQKGIFCHEQVKALKKLGVDVDVAVPVPFYDREVKCASWDYEGVHIRYVRFFKLPGSRDFHRIGYALFASLALTFDLKKYDIYHADAPLPAGQAAMIAGRKYGIPYVVHGHGMDAYLKGSYAEKSNVGLIEQNSRTVYQNAAAIIGVSQKVLDRIDENKERQYVVYNGVDTQRFTPKEHHNEKIRFISTGNLISLKGHDYTIRAFARLEKNYPDKVQLEIIGRGPIENELKELAKSLKVNVQFIGYIPYDEVAEHLSNADVFVLPSWHEALGCVYLEAMASGIPAIGCWENGIDEIIHDGENGLLVHNKNEEELYRVMEKLINESERKEIGCAGCSLVREKYTWIDSAKNLLSIYKELLND